MGLTLWLMGIIINNITIIVTIGWVDHFSWDLQVWQLQGETWILMDVGGWMSG